MQQYAGTQDKLCSFAEPANLSLSMCKNNEKAEE